MTLLEQIHAQLPDFVPEDTANYTLRYIFYRKSDLENEQKNACFSLVTGLWNMHEDTFNRINADADISSCIVEYVCEYNSALCGQVFLVKAKEKEDEQNA